MTEPMSREQVAKAFLGLYEQHKADVGTTTTLILLHGHIHALAERLAAAEETNRIAAMALSEAEARIKTLEKERAR